jgi:aminoglycoside 6'-N-acetyltransferase I
MQILIRDVTPGDASLWEALRCDLWPDGASDHVSEIAMFFAGTLDEPVAVMMAECLSGTIVGFVELSIRADVAGLEGKRIGYVEGLYVKPEFRQRGIAKKLLQTSRQWARHQQCTGFASDRAGRIVIDKFF